MGIRSTLAAVLVLLIPSCALAVVTAYDDAADPVYIPGAQYHSLNGGFGFGPWANNGFPVTPNTNLHAYVGTSTLNDPAGPPLPDIDTGGKAWGNNADPTGNTFLARRSLLNDLTVGGTYSILYDGGDVDGQETISFGLNNNVMCQFYFNPFVPNYQFFDSLSSTNIVTPISQTFGGLSLTLTRDTASTYSFEIIRLSDSLTFNTGPFSYNTSTITGIRTISINNTDGGAGGGHSMYVNAMEATALPEPSELVVMIACVMGIAHRRSSRAGVFVQIASTRAA